MTIYRAFKKYNINNFHILPIDYIYAETSEQLRNNLNKSEIHYINIFKSMNKNIGYNLTLGGNGCFGRILSDETKKKISVANTGIKNGMYGKTWNDNQRQSFKEKTSGKNNHNFGKPLSEQTKKKLSEKLKGRIISDETKLKISKTSKGRLHTEETKQKLREIHIGKTHTEESKQKIKNTRQFGKDNCLSKSVCQLSLDNKLIKIHESISDGARECNTYHSSISNCCRKIKQTSGGFKWMYLDDYNLQL